MHSAKTHNTPVWQVSASELIRETVTLPSHKTY